MANQYTKKNQIVSQKNKKEIFWNVVNAGLAGALVLLGSCTQGGISSEGLFFAVVAALIVVVTKFSTYWTSEKKEYTKAFSFIH